MQGSKIVNTVNTHLEATRGTLYQQPQYSLSFLSQVIAELDFCQAWPLVNIKAFKNKYLTSTLWIWKSRPNRGLAGQACSGVPALCPFRHSSFRVYHSIMEILVLCYVPLYQSK